MTLKLGIGQDSHRFSEEKSKKLVLGGYIIEGHPGFKANSDGDIILHAITNAISSITGVNVLGEIADKLCEKGQTDSKIYLQQSLSNLKKNQKINNLSISLEGSTPKLSKHIENIKIQLSEILKIETSRIGLTITSGEDLTMFGKGKGMQAIVIISIIDKLN